MTQTLKNISDDYLQTLVDESKSYSEILFKMGYKSNGGYVSKLLTKRLKNLNTDKFYANKEYARLTKRVKSDDEIFIENGKYNDRTVIRRRFLLKVEIKCVMCGISNWNNKELSLHLDHINGISTDHRMENLRLLCPNCHSQTSTYSGRNHFKKKTIYYCKCGSRKQRESINCKKCDDKTKIKWPSIENMMKMIWKYPTTKIANDLGVSDTAVKNFCKRNNIEKPGRGYWTKLKGV